MIFDKLAVILLFLSIASSASANGAIKYLKTLPTNSAELITQMYTARVIESGIQKDPLMLTELIQQAPLDPIRTPIVLATFHAWSKLGESATDKAVENRYWNILKGNDVRSIVKFSSGLAAGSLGTRLTIEAVFGDVTEYGSDPKKRAELGAQLFGIGAGVSSSTAIQLVSSYAMKTNLTPHPALNFGLRAAGGIVYFLVADTTEIESKVFLRALVEGRKLDEVIKANQDSLMDKIKNSGKGCPNPLDIAQKLRIGREAHSKYRMEIMSPMIEFETKYLKSMIDLKRQYFQKIRLAEWLLEGSDKDDPEYKSNLLGWRDAKIGQYSISTKNNSVDTKELRNLMGQTRIEYANKLGDLEKDHEPGRIHKYKDLRSSLIFIKSYKSQIENQLELLEDQVPKLAASSKKLKDAFSKLFWVDADSEPNRKRIKDALEELKATWLKEKNRLGECELQTSELLISDLNFVGNELKSHLEMEYFKNLSDLAEQGFISEIKRGQSQSLRSSNTSAESK
ncbi:MAG: hypothetical protein A4S09_16945 [Proteobacteria bacterium SG_bin7]|nr:MAG: hypothetical protein A4S09_16945 [Proteobacteria bacterium SG_bin7]